MTDWLQEYMAIKSRKWAGLAEFLRETFPNEAQKGGPGSGHWGHAGRPGQVGGSTMGRMRGRGAVNREYFTEGPGKEIVASLSPEHRENAIAQLTHMRVQPRHLADLKAIVTEAPPDTKMTNYNDNWSAMDRRTGRYYEIAGAHDKLTGKIHIRPQDLEGQLIIGIEGGYYAGESHVLGHELGHHVTISSPWKISYGADILNRWIRSLPREMTIGGPEWDAGLRPYSFKSHLELKADIWKVYQFGTDDQQDMCAAMIGVDSLDEIFGG